MKRSGWRRLYHLRVWGPAIDEGIDWELGHHLEERVDELKAGGMPEDAARIAASRALGDAAQLRRELRRIDRGRRAGERLRDFGTTVLQDIRYGARGLVRNSGFAAAVILTLALGLGANGALFSVADALLLRPLPFERPDDLVEVFQATPQGQRGQPYIQAQVARQWLAQQQAMPSAFLHQRASASWLGGSEPQELFGLAVTAGFNTTLGVPPLLGRGFTPEDMQAGAPAVALVSWEFWRSGLQRSDDVIGSALELNGIHHAIIGVMPRGFKYPLYSTSQFWVPLTDDDQFLGRTTRTVGIVGRVEAATLAAAEAAASQVAVSLIRETQPASEAWWRLVPLNERRAGNEQLRQAMKLLGGAVVLILLIAGVNMVNLLLLRGAARTREIAMRLALGASRGRLVRQLGTEAMLLALLSGLVATAVAFLSLRVIQNLMPRTLTFFTPHAIELESRTLLFTFVLAVVSGVVFGLLPALRATRIAGAGAGSGLAPHVAALPAGSPALRRTLVATEVALSVTLLVGAGLLMSSFIRLTRVDPGMDVAQLASVTFTVSARDYPTGDERAAYLRLVEERVRAVPGVAATALTSGLPPRGSGIMFGIEFRTEGGEARPYDSALPYTDAGPAFFEVTGARLLAGRAFHSGDSYETGSVIINRPLAEHLWPGQSAVGRRFQVRASDPMLTVIGVADELRLTGLDGRDGHFEMLMPLGGYEQLGRAVLVIRTGGDPRAVLRDVRAAVHGVNPRQVIERLEPLSADFAESIDMQRFLYVVVGSLALLALALSAVGLYGLLSYGVVRRHREIGVRLALGASRGAVRRLIVGEALALAAVGAAAGMAGAAGLSRFIESVLFGVEPGDPRIFLLATLVILAAAIAASLLPAQRAVRVEPAVVLRSD
jgi:putative ABC transport system permease protein